MGLDMYLEGVIDVKDWEHQFEDGVIPEDTQARQIQKIVGSEFPVCAVKISIAYWRKANAIHKWFVDEFMNGLDNGRGAWLFASDLKRLLNVVNEVIASPEKAPELLPTCGGFFFGGIEYDDWYFESLHYTKDVIEKALKAYEGSKNMMFYYQASW